MGQLKKEKTEIPCPGGGKPIKTTYGELASKRSLKSFKGHEYKFKSNDQNKFRQAMDNIERLQKEFNRKMEKAQKDFGEELNTLISNADILLKR